MGILDHTDRRIAELLLERGADPNRRTAKNQFGQTNGWTPLFYAVSAKRSDLVAVLLRHGARVKIRDTRGKSPLDEAKEEHAPDIIKQLEDAGRKEK